MLVAEADTESQAEWDAFVRAAPTGSFLQSWAWGEFQRAAGFPVTRLVVTSESSSIPEKARGPVEGRGPNGALRPRGFTGQHPASSTWHAVCLCIRRPLPLRRFSLSVPWGPVFREGLSAADTAAAASALASAFRERLRGGGVFSRVEPKLSKESGITGALNAAGFTPAERNIQPKDTRILDLSKSEDDLLRAMHPKTRYNIRLASRHGVVVREDTTPRGLQVFLELARDIARRERFHYHPNQYYEALLRSFAPARSGLAAGEAGGPSDMLVIRIAEHQKMPLAAGLFLRFGDTVTYAHGASSSRRKHVMAPYLLHWESISQAKASGAARYDFFGVAPAGASAAHPWFGITRFKQGFGGADEHYVGAVDFIVDPALYRMIEIGRSLRTLLR